ncbi:MAG TPA: hypothetical protein VH164_01310 [Ktedonobacteraceae bacterium]|nr:hypothetical protein [Ktedonobacteraceae bacterium]
MSELDSELSFPAFQAYTRRTPNWSAWDCWAEAGRRVQEKMVALEEAHRVELRRLTTELDRAQKLVDTLHQEVKGLQNE